MIVLMDLCYRLDSLSHDEFVGPISRIVSGTGRKWREMHFSGVREGDLEDASGIILCGTALKDNLFAERKEEFSWLLDTRVPVLGICAGMEVLCLVFGGILHPVHEIGMTGIRRQLPDPVLPASPEFQAYELHSLACDSPPGWVVLAASDRCIQAIRHPDRPVYGVMFHPEVRNDEVVERFLSICGEEGGP